MRSHVHRFALALCAASAVLSLALPLRAQDPPRLAILVMPKETSLSDCICKAEERKAARSRLCDGSTILERNASHSNGQGIVCSSLSRIEVDCDPGRCRVVDSDAMAGSACDEVAPDECTATISFLFGVHSAACHPVPPNGFWVVMSTGTPSPVFGSVGTQTPVQVTLRPPCGTCGDLILSVAMPDGPNGSAGTVLYRYMVAVDCLPCAAMQRAGSARRG